MFSEKICWSEGEGTSLWKKIPDNTVIISDTYLNMVFIEKSGCGIYGISFPKACSYRVILFIAMLVIVFMQCLDYMTVKISAQKFSCFSAPPGKIFPKIALLV